MPPSIPLPSLPLPLSPSPSPPPPPPSPGNHESDNLNKLYGFEGEVKSKYNLQMMELFSEVFNWLPLAHCIEGKILVMEGGIPNVGLCPLISTH